MKKWASLVFGYAVAPVALAFSLLAAVEWGLGFSQEYFFPYPKPLPIEGKAERSRIWCLGDSFTAGAGAPEGRGYPEQLEEALRENGSASEVLNLGHGGTNTSQNIRYLKSALTRGTPEVLFYLGGVNNTWNLAELDPGILRELYGIQGVIASSLQRFRTYKFVFNYLLPKMRGKSSHQNDGSSRLVVFNDDDLTFYLTTGQEDVLIRSLSSRKTMLSPHEALFLGGAFFVKRDYGEASALFKVAAKAYRHADLPVSAELLHAESRRLFEGRTPGAQTQRFYESFVPNPNKPLEFICFWLGKGWVETALGRYGAARASFQTTQEFLRKDQKQIFWFLPSEAIGWSWALEGRTAPALKNWNEASGGRPTGRFEFPLWSEIGKALADRRSSTASIESFFPPGRLPAGSPPEKAVSALLARRGEPESPALTMIFPDQSILHHFPFPHALNSQRHDRTKTVLLHDLAELNSILRRRGVRLVLLGYPEKSLADALDPIYKEFALKNGLRHISLIEKVGDLRGGELWSNDQSHPNEKGYAAIAHELEKELASNGFKASP